MKIDASVLAILGAATATPAGIVLAGQLDRRQYLAVNKVLEAAGFAWDRKARAHIHPRATPAEALESMLTSGEVRSLRELGFFETTGAALELLVEGGDVRGRSVLEPSAGSGNVVRACLAAGAAQVEAFEINGDLAADLGASGAIVHAPQDFLAVQPLQTFERVVMNPPFATPGEPRADLAHVLHALRFLRPGGRLAAIMGAGIAFRTDRRTTDFLAQLAAAGLVFARPLPPGSFTASGTSVSTMLMTVALSDIAD